MGSKKKTITERGITFAPMFHDLVKNGSKTMTRRLTGLDEINIAPNHYKFIGSEGKSYVFERKDAIKVVNCPFGEPGHILYLKESWVWEGSGKWSDPNASGFFVLKSDHPAFPPKKWGSSRFMPKVAAKTWFEIIDVEPRRLSQMFADDVHREGLFPGDYPAPGWYHMEDVFATTDPIMAFHKLFAHLHGPFIVEQDPWIWVISFKRCEKPGTDD